MDKLLKSSQRKEYLITMLRQSIIAEQTAGDFYRYIAQKIKNGKTRNVFIKFADEETKKHKRLLNERIKMITGQTYNPDLNKLDTNVKVASFSLIGALNMAKESERKAIEFYKKAIKKDKAYRKNYCLIIREEKKHWRTINNEKQFQEEKELYRENKGRRLLSLLMQTWWR